MIRYSYPFRLTTRGSTRATAYGFSNKSMTVDNKTHIVWLDAIALVKGRTYDHDTREWTDTFDLFEGADNHTSPTLIIDRNKHLRIAYGPHGCFGGWNDGRFKWAISDRPNAIDKWKWQTSFGYNSTYACMVRTPQDVDVIVYRGGEVPASFMFQRQRVPNAEAGGWTKAKELLRQEIEPQYTHYGGTITCDADGTLYAGCHFYNVGTGDNHPVEGDKSEMRSHGVAVLKSTDLGETWTDLRGESFSVPGVYEERVAVPETNANMYMQGLSIDPKGALWALTEQPGVDDRRLLLSRWTNSGWETVDLQACLPDDRQSVDSALTIDTSGRIHIALTGIRIDDAPDGIAWGRPSCEVFHLVTDGTVAGSQCNMISVPDDTTPSWLPNISQSGLFHPVERPVILYTHGDKGEGCSPATETEAYCLFVEN